MNYEDDPLVKAFYAVLAERDRLCILEVRRARDNGHAQGWDQGYAAGYQAALLELKRLNEAEQREVAGG